MKKVFLAVLFAFIAGLWIYASTGDSDTVIRGSTKIPVNFTVAFIADQGLTDNSVRVLQLIKKEGADMVLHQGDFDYEDSPNKWDKQINSILGSDYPYFASIGNHDITKVKSYQRKLRERVERVNATCVGDLGVKSACTYKGLFFVLSGIGTAPLPWFQPSIDWGHNSYIRKQLEDSNFTWKICSWHKNQRLMQAGSKKDDVGWEAYEACRRGGAIIVTGHDHAYSRTHLMKDLKNQEIASTSNVLPITEGRTFVVVSGLGGKSLYPLHKELAGKEHWAATYNRSYGALFCIFNVNGDENKVNCYFKSINGEVIDEFKLVK